MSSNPQSSERALTWAMLLAKWTEFARAARALPDEGEDGRLKRAVPAIITLHAIACALREVDLLAPADRAAALDVGEVQVRGAVAQLHEHWRGEELHPRVAELIDDARGALRDARNAGLEWLVVRPPLIAEHPAELATALAQAGWDGDLFLPAPGVPLFAGCPAAFARERPSLRGDGSGGGAGRPVGGLSADVRDAIGEFLGKAAGPPAPRTAMRQAYRQFDFAKGGPVRDLVVPFDTSLPAGQPLLVPVLLAGELQPVPLPIPAARQQAPLPVVVEDAGDA